MRIRNITLSHLRTFLSLIRNESFTKAGRDLSVSPATVTSQIKQLEETLETKLLFRTTRSVRLTDKGIVLARQATKIMHLVEAIPQRLGAVENLERGEVKVGIITTAAYVMPKLLAKFHKEHPGIRLGLSMANRTKIWDSVLDGALDIAIMGVPPENTNIESEIIASHNLSFFASPSHPLSLMNRKLTARQLVRYQLLAREVGSGTRLAMAAFFGSLFHQTPFPPIELDTNEGIKQSVMAGLGISLLSDSTCKLECGQGLLKGLDVKGTPLTRHWYAVRLANVERNPAEHSLMEFLKKKH